VDNLLQLRQRSKITNQRKDKTMTSPDQIKDRQTLSNVACHTDTGLMCIQEAMNTADMEQVSRVYPELADAINTINKAATTIDTALSQLYNAIEY